MDMKVNKRLYRSRKERQLAGVCGGLADYIGVDPNIVRTVWIVLTFAFQPTILIYMVMAAMVPEEPESMQTRAEKAKNDDCV